MSVTLRAAIALLVCAVPAAGAVAAELRVGAAAEVITPAAGTPMSGYNSSRVVQSVDDDLFAKAIVIERDGVKVVMVACDLITMPRDVVLEARRLIERSPGIRPMRVMISATHTHTGPLMSPKPPKDPANDVDGDRVRAYVKALPEKIASAVRKADARLVPARAFVGTGHEPRLSYNRRYFMKDGTLGWNPGKLNPNTDRAAGPVDPDVPVVFFETLDKPEPKPIATHVSFAMHPDTRHGDRISADFPGQVADILGNLKGPEMVTLFATGACGDINHVNVNSRAAQISPRESRRLGTILAGEVLKTYGRMQLVPDGELRVKVGGLELPLPEFTAEEVEAARQKLREPPPPKMDVAHVHALKVLDVASRGGKALEAEVQVIALGDDVAWVGLPGEVFVELGLEIKRRSPFKHTILVELANGSIGYIPTKRAFAEGSYEPATARCRPCHGELIVETALSLISDLKPIPEPAVPQ